MSWGLLNALVPCFALALRWLPRAIRRRRGRPPRPATSSRFADYFIVSVVVVWLALGVGGTITGDVGRGLLYTLDPAAALAWAGLAALVRRRRPRTGDPRTI